MIERQPYLPRFMAGGPGNPLGARAMYLGSTVYRIHGTNQPSTIGKFVSSGCIGMLNEDVSDLFERVKVGTRVVVLPGGPPPAPRPLRPRRCPGRAGARAAAGRSRHAADRGAAAARAGDGALRADRCHLRMRLPSRQWRAGIQAPLAALRTARRPTGRADRRHPPQRLALEPGVDALDHLAVMVAKACPR